MYLWRPSEHFIRRSLNPLFTSTYSSIKYRHFTAINHDLRIIFHKSDVVKKFDTIFLSFNTRSLIKANNRSFKTAKRYPNREHRAQVFNIQSEFFKQIRDMALIQTNTVHTTNPNSYTGNPPKSPQTFHCVTPAPIEIRHTRL